MSRKGGGRGLTTIDDSIDARTRKLQKKAERKTDYSNQKQCRQHKDHQNDNNQETKMRRKTTVWTFQMTHKQNSHEKTWTWQRKRNFKRETESLLITAQKNAIRTNHIKARIDKTQQNSRCTLCGDRDETINCIISECCKLV